MDSGQIWAIVCNNLSPLFSDSFECAEYEKVAEMVQVVVLAVISTTAFLAGLGRVIYRRHSVVDAVDWRKKFLDQRKGIEVWLNLLGHLDRKHSRDRFAKALIERILDHTDSLPAGNPFKSFIQAKEGARLLNKAIKKFRGG